MNSENSNEDRSREAETPWDTLSGVDFSPYSTRTLKDETAPTPEEKPIDTQSANHGMLLAHRPFDKEPEEISQEHNPVPHIPTIEPIQQSDMPEPTHDSALVPSWDLPKTSSIDEKPEERPVPTLESTSDVESTAKPEVSALSDQDDLSQSEHASESTTEQDEPEPDGLFTLHHDDDRPQEKAIESDREEESSDDSKDPVSEYEDSLNQDTESDSSSEPGSERGESDSEEGMKDHNVERIKQRTPEENRIVYNHWRRVHEIAISALRNNIDIIEGKKTGETMSASDMDYLESYNWFNINDINDSEKNMYVIQQSGNLAQEEDSAHESEETSGEESEFNKLSEEYPRQKGETPRAYGERLHNIVTETRKVEFEAGKKDAEPSSEDVDKK